MTIQEHPRVIQPALIPRVGQFAGGPSDARIRGERITPWPKDLRPTQQRHGAQAYFSNVNWLTSM